MLARFFFCRLSGESLPDMQSRAAHRRLPGAYLSDAGTQARSSFR